MRRLAVCMIGALTLAACGGDDGDSTATSAPPVTTALLLRPTTVAETTTPAATTTPTTVAPATTMDELERNRTVNVFVDAARKHFACTTIECAFADATYERVKHLWELAGSIPGDDVEPLAAAIDEAFLGWGDCLVKASGTGGDRFTCTAEEIAVGNAIEVLYDSLR